jgi:hypothetical protein
MENSAWIYALIPAGAAVIRLFKDTERTAPAGKLLKAVAGHYAAHKHPRVKAWLERRPQ